jgi:hypothetical protein
MTRLLLCTATILALTASANAQGGMSYWDSASGNSRGYTPSGGPYRAINQNPATGRTYARDADYLPLRKTPRTTGKKGR